MIPLRTLLLVLAFLSFVLAAFGIPTKFNLIAVGLAFATLAFLI